MWNSNYFYCLKWCVCVCGRDTKKLQWSSLSNTKRNVYILDKYMHHETKKSYVGEFKYF